MKVKFHVLPMYSAHLIRHIMVAGCNPYYPTAPKKYNITFLQLCWLGEDIRSELLCCAYAPLDLNRPSAHEQN
jgi:hypothetical protein